MPSLGLGLIALALALMLGTGWSSQAVLLGVCAFGAVAGWLAGALDAGALAVLPARVLGLLEHDLLQALALYALVGALLQRLALADSLQTGFTRLAARVSPGAAPAIAGLLLGALLAPLNGSVGASVTALARAGATPPAERPRRAALVALAGTLGVVVPPSLVLLLLGDAMMRAHTEGLNIARALALPLALRPVRVVNTQDVLQAALLPGLLVLGGWLLVALLAGRGAPAPALSAPSRRERFALWVVPALVVLLLVAVTTGRVRAVEAAAAAGCVLLAGGLASRRLSWSDLRAVLDDAMVLTGALFALLVAATSFSLLLRALGTDRLVGDAMLALQGHPGLALSAVLGCLLAAAFVLDAFELVFLVVPIVMPPLLAQVEDAAWVAALTLLVLQAGFLLPPAGYALVLARGRFEPRPPLGAMVRTLLPYLAWSAVVVGLVAARPEITRWWRSAPPLLAPASVPADDVERLMREMSAPRSP